MEKYFELEQEQIITKAPQEIRPSFDKIQKPLIEKPKPPKLAGKTPVESAFSKIILEFRAARRELEESIERLERLAKIGIMVNKVRTQKSMARPSDDSDKDDSDKDDENNGKK
ncbi:MAG: hypothetical protein ABIH83_02620 [Candidatus Micrarchaeota archaeon]